MMTPSTQTWLEVARLVANFAWGIDRGNPDLAAAQFVEEGKVVLPGSAEPGALPKEIKGRSAISGLWKGRVGVVTRHTFLNLSLVQKAPDMIAGTVLSILYKHEGAGVGDTLAAAISDWDDVIVRDTDGQWRFAERRITPMFTRRAEK